VGQRRETEKVEDRKKAVWLGMRPWLPEVAPLPLEFLWLPHWW
jgi:hypothetical protein